ncbi:3-hydroxyacyl-ACP dehydratase FabZ [Rickettsiales endosymbiont of Stachyamoeba lipophora]|uniref:3-hydroxyacyl-ACP dehydratase FabZ n=1 Tax=Rickettsiales endosymbiont of Stachyamoeba lipophora TaxID=2486578 RepID=UPI000F649CAA|nr:3-hydroxyacyl-ACP dehydratase FabZ [Rickettsiales endosymbiont of Stachyamoeba lipophora]AZL15779.1 3-hydroxyacyl-[acyl-carrier-protein] dehydratase FabZ [Rickettsiales endosymbiont of Stachyamoeba lipophora]
MELFSVDINQILQMIPHRYPILLVDKIVDIKLGESAVGIKNVTFNEPHFMGHFPNVPIMPGVLIVEAMAQTAAALVVKTLGEEAKGKLVYFMTIDQAKFRKPVIPGDVLKMQVVKERNKANVWKFIATAFVEDNKVAEAMFSAMIMDK